MLWEVMGLLNEAAEKTQQLGLSGEGDERSREQSVYRVMKKQKASQGLRCLHHCSECHLIRR